MSDELKQVLVDNKEPEGIILMSMEYFGNTKVTSLPVGDLLYEEHSCVIERKEITDFLSSVKGYKGNPGRIWVQLENMKQNYEHSFLIIVGPFREHSFDVRGFSKKQFLGACASIGARYNIPVYHVDSNEEFFILSRALMLKSDGERKELSTVKRLPVTPENVTRAMVSCVPGIGGSYAKKIIETFNITRARDLCDLSLDDLLSVEGVGPKKAKAIKEWF